ncbi:hypothetical protein ETA_08480 [Erwinia tasmaniensis Et1/99]|uniref:Uncharacterized protein n=1 Tax=Erwinia tasmaniensis (strain DSM 17950 / CFBP 7177 / CIP 109463 / NCPPB 4357 / Et1/99) TaxID=465817 RepID=B2VD07_ERWT9|nr:hypothetical protein ETA_08480 [Erwinia tasmaniensis Et1/99]
MDDATMNVASEDLTETGRGENLTFYERNTDKQNHYHPCCYFRISRWPGSCEHNTIQCGYYIADCCITIK